MSHHVSTNGTIRALCVFHKEKTPSLRIWKDGHFFCYGCHADGHVKDHPQLTSLYTQVHQKQLEETGQLRLPGI